MTDTASRPTAPGLRRLWDREIGHYPPTPTRLFNLGIVVAVTIVLYYQFYLAGAVATQILTSYHMSFMYFVDLNAIGYVLGAIASFCAGVADRYGRANIVTVGLIITSLLCLVGIPNAHSQLAFGVLFVAIGFVEGLILVATPALIRDFSPQLGRASAMGFWTLGPVIGSLIVSLCVSNASSATAWQDQYIACGIVGLVIAAIAVVALRELTPALRDQLMVSERDRALIEARAKGVDVEASLRSPFRQMLKLDILGSAFAISVFLIIYYLAVGFFPVYFQTIFGFSQAKANALGNWFWAFDAGALLVIGYISDKVRVRKPFMIVGAVGAIVFTSMFAMRATHPGTSYGTFVVLLVLVSGFLGIAYSPWMASFTETVERRNPALTATGLAVWGLIIRVIVALTVLFVPIVVDTVTPLVEKGPTVKALAAGQDPSLTPAQNAVVKAVAADPSIVGKVQSLAARYRTQLATAAVIDPKTQAALAANPNDQQAQVSALSEISGVSPADVATVVTLQARFAPALAAAQAIDPATAAALLANPTQATLIAKAVTEIATGLHISAAQAQARLRQLASIPPAQLLTVQTSGPKVAAAAARLTALAKVPPADLAYLARYGTPLKNAKVVADLGYLQKNAPDVLHAAAKSPKQWRTYFWIAVGGEVVFIPLIFVMAGFWDPRKARAQEKAHEEWVQAELAKLAASDPEPVA